MKKIQEISYFLIIITYLMMNNYYYGFLGVLFSIFTIATLFLIRAIPTFENKKSKRNGYIGIALLLSISLFLASETILKDKTYTQTFTWASASGKSIAPSPDIAINVQDAKNLSIQVLPLKEDNKSKKLSLKILGSPEEGGIYTKYFEQRIDHDGRIIGVTPTSAFFKLELDVLDNLEADVQAIVSVTN